jgi:hypothetical protein
MILNEREVVASGRTLRLISFLAQLNLHSWRSKDQLDQNPDNYYETVRYGADLNGVRNGVLNLLQEEFGEASPSHRKASFFSPDGDRDFRPRMLGELERGASS